MEKQEKTVSDRKKGLLDESLHSYSTHIYEVYRFLFSRDSPCFLLSHIIISTSPFHSKIFSLLSIICTVTLILLCPELHEALDMQEELFFRKLTAQQGKQAHRPNDYPSVSALAEISTNGWESLPRSWLNSSSWLDDERKKVERWDKSRLELIMIFLTGRDRRNSVSCKLKAMNKNGLSREVRTVGDADGLHTTKSRSLLTG